MNCLIPAVLVPACLFLQAPVLTAQFPAAVRGHVLDPSGASVPNASVTFTGPIGLVRAARTDEAGSYSLSGVPAGRYTVRGAAPGFAFFESTLDLEGGRTTTLDMRLALAPERQETTVAEPTRIEVDPTQNAAALVVDGKQLDMLADNPDDLQADLLALAGPSAGPSGGQIFIDGISTGQLPAKESIREVRVNGNPFSAEYDRPGFGRVEVLTRPGADRWHGAAGMNFADSALNARNPYSLVKPPSQMRQYDVNLTGPIEKKTSFTLDAGHQGQDSTALINALILDSSRQEQRVNQTVPTPYIRTSLSPRIDYALSQNHTLTGRLFFNYIDAGNNNVGGFTLPSRATSGTYNQRGAQAVETSVIGASMLNETRFQFYLSGYTQRGDSSTPTIVVSGAFTGGGAPLSLFYNNLDNYELTNMTSYTRGKHFVKFGTRMRGVKVASYSTQNFNGTFTFTSIGQYASTLQGLAAGLGPAEIRANGGGPYEYTVGGGTPLSSVRQVDAAPFLQDDWKLKPNLTLSLGLRAETQTNVRYAWNWAPRASLAWGLGGRQSRAPKTVLRFGAGLFYDRLDMGRSCKPCGRTGSRSSFTWWSTRISFPRRRLSSNSPAGARPNTSSCSTHPSRPRGCCKARRRWNASSPAA